MIRFELLKDAGVLVVEPKSALSAEDFGKIARARTSSPACPRQWPAMLLVPDPTLADAPSFLRRHRGEATIRVIALRRTGGYFVFERLQPTHRHETKTA